jgi:hypothetical protein
MVVDYQVSGDISDSAWVHIVSRYRDLTSAVGSFVIARSLGLLLLSPSFVKEILILCELTSTVFWRLGSEFCWKRPAISEQPTMGSALIDEVRPLALYESARLLSIDHVASHFELGEAARRHGSNRTESRALRRHSKHTSQTENDI